MRALLSSLKRQVILALWVLLSVIAPSLAFAQVTVTYFHNDIAGTPQAATDSVGNLLWKENYRPYGERLIKAPASAGNKEWFTGKPQDPLTGLVYMGARYYDPMVGRFMGSDPVGFQEDNLQSFNRYAYANNNPYRYVDPDGRHPLLVLAVVGLFMIDFHHAATSNEPFFGVGSGVAQAGGRLAGSVFSRASVSEVGAAAKGLPDGAKWAQKTFGPNFDPKGTLAGKSFDDVVGGLRSGEIKPSSMQVDYVVRDGQVIIHNTRSASALDAAGIPRSQWNAVNQTGNAAVEARVNGQLARNPGGPFDKVKPSW